MRDYVVKKRKKYVHVPPSLGTDVEWTNRQMFAWRFKDRNSASQLAKDLRSRVVRLIDPRSRRCPRCGNDGNPCSMCGVGGAKKIPCDPVTGEELETAEP